MPCQDLSSAGRQAGLDGARSGLYGEVLRIAGECLPRFVFIENVPALLKYRGRLERDFAGIGYGLTWAKVAAQHVEGCPHRRMRVFVLATLGGRHRGVCDAGPLPPLQGWPTPRKVDGEKGSRTPEGHAKERARKGGAIDSLPDAVGAWPTARAQDAKHGAATDYEKGRDPSLDLLHVSVSRSGADAWPTPTLPGGGAKTRSGSRSGERLLNGAVLGADLLPGVVLSGWATPNASDHRDRNAWWTPSAQRRREKGKQENLTSQMGGRLNPLFVEMLQGLPLNYTAAKRFSQRAEAVRLMHNPLWPAPMVKGLWGDSPQFDYEPPRTVERGMFGKGERAARLRALGNCNPPQLYLRALRLLEQGPQQQSLFGMC